MGSASNVGAVMTLTNSIIGVSVLAMPFCFKQCGIFLSIVMLILSSMVSRLACYFLLKAAQMVRRRNFEFLAFQTFGPMGKFLVELCIIGFLMGTCIAFFVVMGDLGPVIIAKTLNIGDSAALRPSVLIGVGLFVVIPLGLLRNVDSLSSICTASVVFYICFVLKVVVESLPHLLEGDWLDSVHYWRPAGVLQCIPIFSMALFCQTQLFEIYESIPNASLEQMNELIRKAVNICTCVYISVGFFGYVAFCTQNFSGNVLLSFAPSLMSDVIKLGFVMSVAVSFPLTIFPCRASIYSLLFRRPQVGHHDGVPSHIPEARFKCITLLVVGLAMAAGLLVPSIELVLGLVGSTIGVLTCIVFPAVAFVRVSTKGSRDRLLAQVVLFVGALILVLGTYATLYASNEAVAKLQVQQDAQSNIVQPEAPHVVDVNLQMSKDKPPDTAVELKTEPAAAVVGAVPSLPPALGDAARPAAESHDVRQEPPVPVEPAAVPVQATKTPVNLEAPTPLPDVKLPVDSKVAAEQVIHQDAIKKEDEALAEAGAAAGVGKGAVEEAGPNKQQVELLLKLEEHKEEQKKLLQEQQEILQQLDRHKEDLERSKKQQQQMLQQQQKQQQQQILQQQKQQQQNEQQQQILQQKQQKEQQQILQQKQQQKEQQQQKMQQQQKQNKTVSAATSAPAVPRPDVPVNAAGSDVVVSARPQVLLARPAQPRTLANKSRATKPRNIIPLPLAVQDDSKLYGQALQQVAESRLTPGEAVPAGREEKVVQRDILSNLGPSHERERRSVEEHSADPPIQLPNSFCDIPQKNTTAEGIAPGKPAISREAILLKTENKSVPGEVQFDSGKHNDSLKLRNVTVLAGGVKKSLHSHNESRKVIKDKTDSETIMKMVPYLSVQSLDGTISDLVSGIDNADGWKHLESLVKPMSRDLKSVMSQQILHDAKTSAPKLSEKLEVTVTGNSITGELSMSTVGVNASGREDVSGIAASQNLKPVTAQKVNNLHDDAARLLEVHRFMVQKSTYNVSAEFLNHSEMVVKPISRDLKSLFQEANGVNVTGLTPSGSVLNSTSPKP